MRIGTFSYNVSGKNEQCQDAACGRRPETGEWEQSAARGKWFSCPRPQANRLCAKPKRRRHFLPALFEVALLENSAMPRPCAVVFHVCFWRAANSSQRERPRHKAVASKDKECCARVDASVSTTAQGRGIEKCRSVTIEKRSFMSAIAYQLRFWITSKAAARPAVVPGVSRTDSICLAGRKSGLACSASCKCSLALASCSRWWNMRARS